MFTPRIAVIGFGMAGIGAVHALRHVHRFTSTGVKPRITIFEAGEAPGGKAAPDNVGAQFIDAAHGARGAVYPFDRLLDDLDLTTHPAREDYELVQLRMRSAAAISASTFGHALTVLRAAFSELLTNSTFAALDRRTVHQVLHTLQQSGRLSADGSVAMRQRMLLEDGTTALSALGYALSLAKSPTPQRRLEVKGGLYRIAAQARDAAVADGVTLLMSARVTSVHAAADSVRVMLHRGGHAAAPQEVHHFDAAILAVSPEHLSGVTLTGAVPPVARLLAAMPCARMTKTNIALRGPVRATEHATERYAMWFSTPHSRRVRDRDEAMATFFHGWENEPPLSMNQMLKAALGRPDDKRVVRVAARSWDASAVERGQAVPMGYITEPRTRACVPLLRASRALYFSGASSSALVPASHALGIGGGVREAALCGEWAVVAVLRRLGCDVTRALQRVTDPQLELYGAPRQVLARALRG